jgi:thiamine-monophosphate kinase
MKISELGEFGLIERIKDLVACDAKNHLIGIDDDAAAVRVSPEKILLATTDALIEGVHFDMQYFTFHQLGWRTLAANLSDIAAMGGQPRFALVALGLPPKLDVESALDLYRGMKAIGDEFGTAVIGGDTTRSPDRLFISITVLGEVAPQKLLRRSGAQIGDAIFVTGQLGGSAAGLRILKSSDADLKSQFSAPVERHLTPCPRVNEAQFLAEHFPIHSMIDVSDGLASEVRHICKLSDVGARVKSAAVPIHPQTETAAKQFGESALEYALGGGEDFELLFTAPAEVSEELRNEFLAKFNLPCSEIGVICDKIDGMKLLSADGEQPLLARGFDHFLEKA